MTRFRGKTALRLSLNVTLEEMFSQNIGPASSIGNEDRDPTLRPVILNSWPGEYDVQGGRVRDGKRDGGKVRGR